MDPARRGELWLFAPTGADAEAASERASRLFDDVAQLVLPLLPPDARACVMCVRKAWFAAATGEPSLWAELSFERCAARVTDAALASLCKRAGPALTALRLDSLACSRVSATGMVAALRDGGCAGVRTLYAPTSCGLTPTLVAVLVEACPGLRRTKCVVRYVHQAETAVALAQLPGPVTLEVGAGDLRMADPLPRSVRTLHRAPGRLRSVELVSLCEMLRTDSRLTALKLNNASMRFNDAAAISEALLSNYTLTSLDLADNDIGSLGAAELAAALEHHPEIMSLDLRNNSIGATGAAALCELLQETSALTELDLRSNRIEETAAALFAQALELNDSLTRLDLGGNSIRNEGAISLAEVLLVNSSSLTSLNLARNDIGPAGAAALGLALCSNTALSSLMLNGNDIGDAGATALAEALHGNCALTSLNLSGNELSSAAAVALAAALRVNGTLKTLDLFGNKLGSAGANALGAALDCNRTLTSLDLGVNNVDDMGAAALAETVLSVDSMLMPLEGNRSCARLLAAATKGCKTQPSTLVALNLEGNAIGNLGAAAFALALRTNCSLTSLNLGRNDIGNDGVTALSAALLVNRTLTSLELTDQASWTRRNLTNANDMLAELRRWLRRNARLTHAPPSS